MNQPPITEKFLDIRLTLDAIPDLLVGSLRRELEFVSENPSSGGLPVGGPGSSTCDPLSSDIGVDLDIVRVTIIGFDGHPKVRKGKRLVNKIGWLHRDRRMSSRIACSR